MINIPLFYKNRIRRKTLIYYTIREETSRILADTFKKDGTQ